jgi:hypothetical protein
MEMDHICPICHETLESDVILVKHINDESINNSRKRGHYFHKNCIKIWRKESNLCPMDRDKIMKTYKVESHHITGLNLKFFGGCYYNMINKVKLDKKLLKTIKNINDIDAENKTLAYHACEIGNYNLVLYLLNIKADFSIGNINGFTPLMVAICQGHSKICLKLLSKKYVQKTVNCHDSKGMNAFYYACKYNRYDIIIDLLGRNIPTKHQINQAIITYRSQLASNYQGKKVLQILIKTLSKSG